MIYIYDHIMYHREREIYIYIHIHKEMISNICQMISWQPGARGWELHEANCVATGR